MRTSILRRKGTIGFFCKKQIYCSQGKKMIVTKLQFTEIPFFKVMTQRTKQIENLQFIKKAQETALLNIIRWVRIIN